MRRSRQSTKFLILLFLLFCITLGYAFVSTTLKIEGQANVLKQTWNVYWDDARVTNGSVSNIAPTITEDYGDMANTKLVWNVTLKNPSDFYEFTVYAVNEGTIDAMITKIEDSVSPALPSYIKYDVTYIDGTTPSVKDKLIKRSISGPSRVKYKVRIYFDENSVEASQINSSIGDKSYNFSLKIYYSQADETAYADFPLGKEVKYDPVSNTTCSSGSTCYTWNILDVYGSTLKEYYTLQMDHNITENIPWIEETDYTGDDFGTHGKTDKGPISALKRLELETSGWNDALKLNFTYDTTLAENNYGILKCVNGACDINGIPVTSNLKARILTGEELADITISIGVERDTPAYNWTLSSTIADDWYFFSRTNYITGTRNQAPAGKTYSKELGWLVHNTTYNSYSGGTNNSYGSDTDGYWTLSPTSDDITQVWSIGGSPWDPYNGNLGAYYVNAAGSYGLRPIITIPKSILTN